MPNDMLYITSNVMHDVGRVATALHQALAARLVTHEPPLPALGAFHLSDNPDFSIELYDLAATATGLYEPLNAFLRVFQQQQMKPVKPDPAAFGTPSADKAKLAAALLDYHHAMSRFRDLERLHQVQYQRAALIRQRHYHGDRNSYLDFVLDFFGEIDRQFFARHQRRPMHERHFQQEHQLVITPHAFERHLFLTGGTGSGKSNSLKYIIQQLIETRLSENSTLFANSPCIILFDPHGLMKPEDAATWNKPNLARNVAEFPYFQHRPDDLLLFDPSLSNDRKPIYNPFDMPSLTLTQTETYVSHLINAFSEIIKGLSGTQGGLEFSPAMKTFLEPVLTALVAMPHADLSDLLTFTQDETDDSGIPLNQPLVKRALQHPPSDDHRAFFRTRFYSSNLTETKKALYTRFASLLNKPTIKSLCVGSSSFDLEAAIDAGNTILISLPKSYLSDEAIQTIGQLLISRVQNYVFRRFNDPAKPKRPIYLFADECEYFLSSTTIEALKQTRKYGLHLIFATQQTDRIPAHLKAALLSNCGTVLAGRNQGETARLMADRLLVKPEQIARLNVGEFLVRIEQSATLHPPTLLIKPPLVETGSRAMKQMQRDAYLALLDAQLARHYRAPRDPRAASSRDDTTGVHINIPTFHLGEGDE